MDATKKKQGQNLADKILSTQNIELCHYKAPSTL